MKLLLILAIIATVLFAGVLLFLVITETEDRKRFEKEEGVILFRVKIKTVDFFSMINTFVSYLMAYGELDLNDFIDKNFLRLSKDADFHLIERCINMYPIVECKYLGDGKYKLDKFGMSEKYEEYQEQTHSDNYIIPLFDLQLITRYSELFNFSTRYQQILNTKNIANQAVVKGNFNDIDKVIDELEDAEDNNYIVKRRYGKLQYNKLNRNN